MKAKKVWNIDQFRRQSKSASGKPIQVGPGTNYARRSDGVIIRTDKLRKS